MASVRNSRGARLSVSNRAGREGKEASAPGEPGRVDGAVAVGNAVDERPTGVKLEKLARKSRETAPRDGFFMWEARISGSTGESLATTR